MRSCLQHPVAIPLPDQRCARVDGYAGPEIYFVLGARGQKGVLSFICCSTTFHLTSPLTARTCCYKKTMWGFLGLPYIVY